MVNNIKMSKLYIVREESLNQMKQEIPTKIDTYKAGEYPQFDSSQLSEVRGIQIPDDLENKMIEAIKKENNRPNFFEPAKLLRESLLISPLLASEESVWVYLTHGPLQKFTHTVWDFSQLRADQSEENYVRTHWFLSSASELMRNALASLWWSIEISRLKDEEDPYRLSKVLFSNYTLRVVSFAQVLRQRNVLRGILEWINKNIDLQDEALEQRGIFIAKYLNQLAGIKQLTVLKDSDIEELLDDVKDVIMSITSRRDIAKKTFADIMLEQRTQVPTTI